MNNTTNTLKKQCIAEFLGTGSIIFFGVCSVAGLRLAGALFGQWEVCIIWAIAVAMAVYFSIKISGAHLNPAVTVALCLFSNFEKRKVMPYILSQVFGAFCATALVYSIYCNLFCDYEYSHNIVRGTIQSLDLASVFSSYPNPKISLCDAFMTEIVITSLLMIIIMAVSDEKIGIRRGPITPLIIGLLMAVIGYEMERLTGASLNPARDLGPKIFVYIIGWGNIAFTGGKDVPYFLVPLVGPLVGSCLGAYSYHSIIRRHLPFKFIRR